MIRQPFEADPERPSGIRPDAWDLLKRTPETRSATLLATWATAGIVEYPAGQRHIPLDSVTEATRQAEALGEY